MPQVGNSRFIVPVFCFVILVLNGCTAPSKGLVDKDLLEGNKKALPYEKMRDALTRGDQSLGTWKTEAYLLTKPLIESREMERGKKNMDSETRIAKSISESMAVLSNGKVCFRINIEAYSIDHAEFKNWVGKIEDKDGKLYEVAFSNLDGVNSIPEGAVSGSLAGAHTTWFNSSLACTAVTVPLISVIKLHLIPQFKTHNNSKAVLTWGL